MDAQPKPMKPARPSEKPGSAAGFATLCEEIDQLFENLGMPDRISTIHKAPAGRVLTPPVELKETPDQYELAIELPGMERKDITVEFAAGVLSVVGEKRTQSDDQSGHRIISERSYGVFRRRFSLPQNVDPARIAARYRHGVLMVTIGKDAAAENRVRAIAVT